jgi:hypothetical protein
MSKNEEQLMTQYVENQQITDGNYDKLRARQVY